MAFGDKVEFKLEPPASIEDLRGRVFGRLTVVEYFAKDERRQSKWLCVCIEGNVKVFSAHSLKSGGSQSCGCLRNERMRESKSVDYTGKQFNYLIGIRRSETKTRTEWLWHWKCIFNGPNCKGEIKTRPGRVTSGDTMSCGCFFKRQCVINLKTLHRRKRTGENKDTARVEVEWEYEQEQMQLEQRKAEAAAMNWGDKLPEPEFNWTNKLPGTVTVAPDFDWWKDKLKGSNNANTEVCNRTPQVLCEVSTA